jgi:RAD3-like DEAD/DEAH box helicase
MTFGSSWQGGSTRNLLEDLRKAALPTELGTERQIVEMVKALHLHALRQGLRTPGPEELTDEDVAELRSYGLWLEDYAFAEAPEEESKEVAINVAASIFELVGVVQPDDAHAQLFSGKTHDLLRSAIVSGFLPYQAAAAQSGGSALKFLVEETGGDALERVHAQSAVAIAAFAARRYALSIRAGYLAAELLADAVAELQAAGEDPRAVLALDQDVAGALACSEISKVMLMGIGDLSESAINKLDELRTAAAQAEDGPRYWLSTRLGALARQMTRASMHAVLVAHEVHSAYRESLAQEGILELWRPQRQAIDEGLLDEGSSPNLVMSIPTGTGKSFVAELAILSALKKDPSSWVFYLAPSRALVNQVSQDLRRRLASSGVSVRTHLAGAEYGLSFDEEIQLVGTAGAVTVTTPEKLDTYYRNSQPLFDSCALLIVDEAHKVGEPRRGPVLESLITRFRLLQPATRIVLMSGVTSNPSDLQEWVGQANLVTERRRAVRQVRGVAVRYEPLPKSRRQTQSGEVRRRVDFTGGIILGHERDDLTTFRERPIDLLNVFGGHLTERLAGEEWRELWEASKSSSVDHAVKLAETLARSEGTSIFFMQRVDSAERCCRDVSLPDEPRTADLERVAAFVAAELGEDHELPGHIRRGVGFHHAQLPASVQRAVELALDRGWLKTLFTTATLREGVNTAATNVVIVGHSLYDQYSGRRIALPPSDFENAAGRAGRPFREPEGRVFLIPERLARALQVGTQYLVTGPDSLIVQSQFQALADVLHASNGEMRTLREDQQSILLGLKAAGLTDVSHLSQFFGRSLWGLQVDEDSSLDRIAREGSAAFDEAEESVGESRVALAGRTGFSLGSMDTLWSTLEQLRNTAAGPENPLEEQVELTEILLSAVLGTPEVTRGNFWEDDWRKHVAPASAWMEGQSYAEILSAGIGSELFLSNASISEAVRYGSFASSSLSWGLGACYLVAQEMSDAPPPFVGFAPLSARYGMPNPAACYVSMLGVTDRFAAQSLAEVFNSTGRSASINEVSLWMSEFDSELEGRFGNDPLRAELLRRQAFREPPRVPTYLIVRCEVAAQLHAGETLGVELESGEIRVKRGNTIVATHHDLGSFTRLAPSGGVGSLLAVPTSSAQGGQTQIAFVN